MPAALAVDVLHALPNPVIAGLDPAIAIGCLLTGIASFKLRAGGDGQDRPGHDGVGESIISALGMTVVHSIVDDPDQLKLIETWRLRHAYPDAIGIWAASSGLEARAFAFNAIAQDPRVLRRAERLVAIKMATQAEDFASSLAVSDIAKSDTWIAIALYVQRSIDMWRRSFRAYDRQGETTGMSAGATIQQARLSDPWEIARRNFPYVEDDTGMLATRILRGSGGTVLKRARKPWDHVIALAVLRYAARLLRGERAPTAPGFTREQAIADILTVQSYAEESGLSPMAVGYTGPGRPALQALELLRDAHTLRDAVRDTSGGGEIRASVWQRAIDFHAYGVVALDHGMLLRLSMEEAFEIAAAAGRQADMALREPLSAEMPLLPLTGASAPEAVRLHANVCLPARAMGQPRL
jgi:hypothetical protein